MTKPIADRERLFRMTTEAYVPIYGRELIDEFCSYWTEMNKSKKKMRFEYERTWCIDRRLKTWQKNSIAWNKFNYATDRTVNKNSADRQEQFRREREQRIAARIARLAEEDGGGM